MPGIYWTDFLLSLAITYGAIALYLLSPRFSPLYFSGFTIAAFGLFRCGVFIHEIAHLPKGRMRLFPRGVEYPVRHPHPHAVLCLQVSHGPSQSAAFRDREGWGVPGPGGGSNRRIVIYLLQIPLLPALAIVRFLVVTPLSFLHPRLRRLVLERGLLGS